MNRYYDGARPVAIKVLNVEGPGAAAAERFGREARALAVTQMSEQSGPTGFFDSTVFTKSKFFHRRDCLGVS